MQNRFTFKDLVFFATLLAVAVTTWLNMAQLNRMEQLMRGVGETLARGITVSRGPETPRESPATPAPAAGGGAAGAGRAAVAPAARDERWARAGVRVEWQPEPAFATDPSTVPGFQTGGEFVDVFEAQPQKVTPFLYADVYGTRVLDRVCEGLGTFDPATMKMVGALADAWQIDPDGLWIRVHINPRAVFSDGKPVTAEDVRWTYKDFILNKAIDADRARSVIEDVLKDVVVVDPQTVEFTFKDAVFSNILITMGEPILPKHYYSQFEPSQINPSTGLLMGSGPFRMQRIPAGPQDLASQWTPGNDIVLVRNERWWAGKAPLDGMRFRVITSELPRLVAFRNNEASMIVPTSPQYNTVLRSEPDFEKSAYALKWVNMRSGYSFIAWQAGPRGETGRTTPFKDKRVRQAMTLLLDREKMIRDIWDGIGIVAKGPFNPESPASNPAVKPWAYDPVRAKALLKEAGWEDRNGDGILENKDGEKFEFEFTYASGGEIAERISRFVSDSYTKAGIVCKTRPVDWSRYQDITKSRDFDAITMAWGANAPESDLRQMFHSDSIAKGKDNFTQWSSKEADELIEKGRRTMDTPTRMLIWQQLEAVLAEEQPYTFVRVPPWLRFVKRDFGNVRMYKTGLVPDEFFHLRASMSPGT